MYRTFYLTNSLGNTWQLTDQSFKAFLNNPQGLGQSETLTTTIYGEVARVDDEEFAFPQVSGELLFYDDANSDRYQKYNNFARFISYTPLTLHYTIPTSPAETYTLPCYCVTISKSETGRNGILTCGVTFQGTDFWHGEEVTVTGTSSISLTNEGDYPVGFEITIEGTGMTEPYFTLTQDDIYGETKLLTETFTSIYINSNDTEQNMELESNGSVLANPLSYQDLSISNGSIYVTFLKLKRGTSTLDIGMTSGTLTGVTIKFTPRYRSV